MKLSQPYSLEKTFLYLASRGPGWLNQIGARLWRGCLLQNGQYNSCCCGLDDSNSDRGRRCGIFGNVVIVLIFIEQLVKTWAGAWEIYVHVVAARGDLLRSLHPSLWYDHEGVL